MRKLVSLVFVFSIMMLFVLAVSPAFAKPGSVKVDNDDAADECADPDREVNLNPDDCTGTALLWVSVVSEQEIGIPTCSIACNDGSTPSCDMSTLEYTCQSPSGKKDQWLGYDLVYADSITDGAVCTVTVIGQFGSDNDVIGLDSWRQDCP